MIRSWRLRRRNAVDDKQIEKNVVQQRQQRDREHRIHYPPHELRTVTIVSEEGEIDKGLVWSNRTNDHNGNNNDVILIKVRGTAKLHHADLQTGMHLISVNNIPVDDAMEARELCEEVQGGEALTLLLWKPSSTPSPTSTTTAPTTKTNDTKAPKYVTASIYKECMESKTGVSLQTSSLVAVHKKTVPHSRAVRITRLNPTTPAHLRTGMRLISINNYSKFTHHTEAVALIRSLPAGYVTLLFADDENRGDENHSQRSSVLSHDDGTASLTTSAEDDASSFCFLDASRRGGDSFVTTSPASSASERSWDAIPEQPCTEEDKNKSNTIATASATTTKPPSEVKMTTAPQTIMTTILTPDEAQQVVLTENQDDVVYVHEAPPSVASLQTGMRVMSLNGQEMASAGHYEHFLQTADDSVTLCACWERSTDGTASAVASMGGIVSATAYKETFDTKTGIVLSNGPNNNSNKTVVITRIATNSSFPTLAAGMRILSINGHDWFTDCQEAIGMIRSIQGEITIVAMHPPGTIKEESA